MYPTSPMISNVTAEPNPELLRRSGWSVNSCHGAYCVAWRGRDEVVFAWQDGAWMRVGGRGGADEM